MNIFDKRYFTLLGAIFLREALARRTFGEKAADPELLEETDAFIEKTAELADISVTEAWKLYRTIKGN